VKKTDTIAETPMKTCLRDCVKIVLDDRPCNKLRQASLFNDRVKSRIVEMSSDIKIQLTSAVTFSAFLFPIDL